MEIKHKFCLHWQYLIYMMGTLTISILLLVQTAVAAGSEEIRIGLTAALSGGDAEVGALQVKVAQVAVTQFNATSGSHGRKVQLFVEDTKSTAEGAVEALKRLLEDKHVHGVIGPDKSFQLVAMSPLIQRMRIPMIIGGTNPRLTDENNKWMFRCRPDDMISAYGMVQFIKTDSKMTKIGILHENDVFGSGGANLVEKFAKEIGLSVVKRESFEKGATDFSAKMTAINNSGAEALVVYATTRSAADILREFRKTGKQQLMIGSASSANFTILNEVKGAADGNFAVVDTITSATELGRKFVQAFRKEYGSEPDTIQLYVADGLRILATEIAASNGSSDVIRSLILKLKNFKGTMGTYNFTPNGDGLHEVTVVKIIKGSPVLVKIIAH